MSTDTSDSGRLESESGRSPGTGGTQSHRPKVLAFYLPQFHPIPENDEWWEPGFTEWSNVVRARPLFPGHYQPHLPGELGFYDLRVPEVREQQAALARQYGIYGFVYYHYWFHGRRLLERPFEEVLSSGHPDFPFALCWANEEWTRNWDALSGNVLVEQRFSEADDLAHIRWLVRAFADERYIKIDGRPLMLVYRSDLLPNPKRTTDLWRRESQAAGFPDIYLAMVESRHKNDDPRPIGFDASVGFASDVAERLGAPLDAYRENLILDYDAATEAALHRPETPWKRFPGVMVGWDNSPRRKGEAVIFSGGTPEAYGRWLRRTVESVSDVRDEENLIFVTAWNEWAEGNHLEPDRRYGRGYLEATRAAIEGTAAHLSPDSSTATDGIATPGTPVPLDSDSAAGNALRMVREVITDPRRVVEIGAPTPGLAAALEADGIVHRSIAPDAVGHQDTLLQQLDSQGDLGALLLGDVIERWSEPHQLLATLSNWACDHGKPSLVISIANVAHFDVGLLLLCGRWDPPSEAQLEGGAVRYFTRGTLERLFRRCGWKVAISDDHETIFSPHHPAVLDEDLPEAMAGALRVLAQSYNPDWAVDRFVWALTPVGVDEPPASYEDAVGGPEEVSVVDASLAVSQYLSSIGLLAGENHVRAEDQGRRARLRLLRDRIQWALVELALPDEWAEELPLFSDTVDDLAELYMARSDLVNTFDDEGTFDALSYVEWAIGDIPTVSAAVSKLRARPRREATVAIRPVLATPDVDQRQLEAATDVLVDLLLDRRDIQFTEEDGATLDAARFLEWALSTDDPSADRLAPYRGLIESAISRLYEGPRRQATLAIQPALSTPNADQRELDAATDLLVDLLVHRRDIQFTQEDGTTLDTARFLEWTLSTDDPSADRLVPYRALIDSAIERLYEGPRRQATLAIRPLLSTAHADPQEVEAATDVLVDLYLRRRDIQFTQEDGTMDTTRLVEWAATTRDSSSEELSPYRGLLEAARASLAARLGGRPSGP